MAKRIEDRVVDTFLPLIPWTTQKLYGPLFSKGEWHSVILSFVPPPESIASPLRKLTDFTSPALHSPSARRKVRAYYKHRIRREERNCHDEGKRMRSAAVGWILQWRRDLEGKGYKFEPSRVVKVRDAEKATLEFYARLEETDGFRELFPFSLPSLRHDAVGVALEMALGQWRPETQLPRAMRLLGTLGLNLDKLRESLSSEPPEAALRCLFDDFYRFLVEVAPQVARPQNRGLIRRLLMLSVPRETEPRTTPEAIAKAVGAGLVWRGHKLVDEETGKVEVKLEDPHWADWQGYTEMRLDLEQIIADAPPGQARAGRLWLESEETREAFRQVCLSHGEDPSKAKANLHRLLGKFRRDLSP